MSVEEKEENRPDWSELKCELWSRLVLNACVNAYHMLMAKMDRR